MAVTAFIGFGGNLGDKVAIFKAAVKELEATPGIEVKVISEQYETEPVGLTDDGPSFLNAVINIETMLDPHKLFSAIRSIEKKLGKADDHKSDHSRRIDLDLLFYGDVMLAERGLTIPHPRIHSRAFVLLPLAEIAADFVHPQLRKTVGDLAGELTAEAQAGVKRLN